MQPSTLQPCKRDHTVEERFRVPEGEEGRRGELWDFSKQQPVSISAPETLAQTSKALAFFLHLVDAAW